MEIYRLNSGVARVSLRGGVSFAVEGPAEFQLPSSHGLVLHSGKMAFHVPEFQLGFTVQTAALRVRDLGTEFGVAVGDDATEVQVFAGAVETSSRTRLPVYYWNFDHASGAMQDVVKTRLAIAGSGVARREGLVGNGALFFDGTENAFLDLGSEGFTPTTGVTLEAMVAFTWDGKGYREIFRRNISRRLYFLGFQSDDQSQPTIPAVEMGPCLSFGLCLDGSGFSEIDMPLDGRNGRPSLAEIADGKPHHIVATYDARTGRKVIYIDGVERISHRFEPRSQILSDGPAIATLGNVAPDSTEPFHGIIDEFAYYEFALSADEIQKHWNHVHQGKNYFGDNFSQVLAEQGWPQKMRLSKGEAFQFSSHSGLPLAPVEFNRDRFPKVLVKD